MKRVPKPKLDFTHDIGPRHTLRMESVNCELIARYLSRMGYLGFGRRLDNLSSKIRENLRLGF